MNSLNYSIPKDIVCETLIELAERDERIVVLSSDLSVSTNIEPFMKRFPERFFELGIAEQSTMSIAGGLATEGFIPVYVALAIFSCGMTWPQMRQVCNANLNVKIIGTHAGVDDGQDGSGHHATEDMAITRVLPRMTVLAPSDANDVAAAVRKMLAIEGPTYMRVARESSPVLHAPDCSFDIGKADILFDDGNDFAIVFEGAALSQALDGWNMLSSHGIKGKLVSIRSIKPIDKEMIEHLASNVKVLVSVENHSIIGGLHSCIADILVDTPYTAKVAAVGFDDRFLESGSSIDIKNKYGVSGKRIFSDVINALNSSHI